jgi:hypothetical protein
MFQFLNLISFDGGIVFRFVLGVLSWMKNFLLKLNHLNTKPKQIKTIYKLQLIQNKKNKYYLPGGNEVQARLLRPFARAPPTLNLQLQRSSSPQDRAVQCPNEECRATRP